MLSGYGKPNVPGAPIIAVAGAVNGDARFGGCGTVPVPVAPVAAVVVASSSSSSKPYREKCPTRKIHTPRAPS